MPRTSRTELARCCAIRGSPIVALASLALGIGASSAIFSLLDAVMLRSLPVKDPQQLVLLGEGRMAGIGDAFVNTDLYSYPFYRQLQQKNSVFSGTAAILSMINEVHGFVDGRTETEPMKLQLVSGTYFPTLGVLAQMGRVLTDQDDDNSEGDHPVAVVSDSLVEAMLWPATPPCSTASSNSAAPFSPSWAWRPRSFSARWLARLLTSGCRCP